MILGQNTEGGYIIRLIPRHLRSCQVSSRRTILSIKENTTTNTQPIKFSQRNAVKSIHQL